MKRWKSTSFFCIAIVSLFYIYFQSRVTSSLNRSIRTNSDDSVRSQEHTPSFRNETTEHKDSRNERITEDTHTKVINARSSNSTKATVDAELSALPIFKTHELCSYISSQHFSATRFWQQNTHRIFEASRNPLIPQLHTAETDAKMRLLLETILLPSRLRKAMRHMPTVSHRIVNHVVEIIQKRIQDPDTNPPLRVAVFGGSVTVGTSCFQRGRPNLNCAWPKRLELLLNQFAKKDIIKVYNLAIGGTTSETGTKIVKYWMYPNELSKVGPDVIINSYSTNDSLPPRTMWPNDDVSPIVMSQVRNHLQDFVREALRSRQCTVQPLVVHVDDYLGPKDAKLFRELSYGTAMTQIAEWYDTMAISYNEVVRDIYYRNFEDKTFGNNKDVHYGHWAHQTIAWLVGFASLDLISTYCDDEYVRRKKLQFVTGSDGTKTNNTNDIVKTTTTKSTATIHKIESVNNELMEMNTYLPPPLAHDISVEDAAEKFTVAFDLARQSSIHANCTLDAETEEDKSPCIVSWIAAPGGYDATKIRKFIAAHKISVNGWKVEKNMGDGWANKIGWIANDSNATFSLEFKKVAKHVKTVTIYFMRSYGEKWRDSMAEVTISRSKDIIDGDANVDSGGVDVLSKVKISGVHTDLGFKYSLTLSHTITLLDIVKKGETIAVAVDLIAGSHFKIMGMMICNK